MPKTKEKIFLLLIDFITINLAWIIFYYFRVETGWFDLISTPQFIIPMLVVYFYWLLVFTFVGMYRTWFALSRFDEISSLFKASFVGIFILFFIIFIDDADRSVPNSNRFLIFIYWGIFLFFVGSGRLLVRSIQRKLLINGFGRRKTLIIGFNEKSNEIHDQLNYYKALGLDVAGYVAVEESNLGKNYKNIEVVGHLRDLTTLINKYNINEIIIVLDKHESDLLVEIISMCEGKNVGLKIVPDLYEILSGQAKTMQIYGFPLIDIMPELMPEWEKKLKRIIDIIFSIFMLIISSPIFILTAIAIKFESKGPVFFKQERSGLNGKPFLMIKFRSMREDAEKLTGPVWSQKDDPRITKIGKFIRKVRIDELPQFINVLKGEMSLVGPRPERPYFVELLSKDILYYKRRLKVRPGLTGWAQVKHKYDESIEDVKIKLRYDLFYIENMSLRMDFKILFRTVFVVLFGKGHYE